MRFRAIAFAVLLVAAGARAQEDNARITPVGDDQHAPAILTTKSVPQPLEPLPWIKQKTDTVPAGGPKPAPAPFGGAKPNSFQGKVPFGKATAPMQEIPSGPHTAIATPVENVDSIEVSEPAPPTPVAPEADPATQDPAEPTELTSPMFDQAGDSGAPRKILIRVLNKVTAQSTLFRASPGDTVKFGRLEINTIMCRVSAPNSQKDYAALLDIHENLPDNKEKKPLFRGWMYASSPSIEALEHPIYDVTMVSCDLADAEPKKEEKPQKKAKK